MSISDLPDHRTTVALRFDPSGRTRGAAREVEQTDAAGSVALTVTVDPTEPRPGWAGAVDSGLPFRRAGAALARYLAEHRHTGGPGGPSGPPGSPDRSDAAGSDPDAPVVDPVVVVDADDLTRPSRDHRDGNRSFAADFVLGYLLGAHAQDALAGRPRPTAADLVVVVGPDADHAGVGTAVDAAGHAARATATARSLAGAPSNIKTPAVLGTWMTAELTAAGMQVEVLDEDALAAAGFGGVLAVGGGSARPPRVVVARRPGSGARVLLVGKGITFDTGGISIKPAADMHLMRTDMAGSAAVVSAAAAFCSDPRPTDVDIDLTVVVAAAENMVSGSAYRPGDVVTHLGGITSEVTNTDAEGRMVLADALVHGIAVADPDLVIDVATLTGAMKLALGMRTGAVLSTDDDLAGRIAVAGAAAGERWWRLPLVDDLRASVTDSPLADRRQAPGGPGAITAALFLEGFVDGRPWAHLDIAGPARSPEAVDEVGPVATGFATRTLLEFLRRLGQEPRPDGRTRPRTPVDP